MAVVNLPHALTNPKVVTAAELNANFAAVSAQVNGNLDGANVAAGADLAIATMTADEIICDVWTLAEAVTIKLPSTDGSHSVIFKDSDGNAILTVASDGGVVMS